MVGIKGFEMPKKCSECPMYKQSGIDVYCGADYVGIDNAFKKRDNCPLVEIITCKYCANRVKGALDEEICLKGHELIHENFYCADGESEENK